MKVSQYNTKSGSRKLKIVIDYDENADGVTPESDEITVVYNPAAYSEELIEQFFSVKDSADGEGDERSSLEALSVGSRLLSELLTESSLENEDGTPYPLTREYLRKLPLGLLSVIAEAVMKDQNPGND